MTCTAGEAGKAEKTLAPRSAANIKILPIFVTRWEEAEGAGPPPPGSDDGVPRLYLTEDEMNL